jgi:hypothetical protein
LNELKKDDPDPRVIVRLVSGDVGLSAAVLKTVNSPFFGLSRRISSVAQAVSLLGMKAAAQIVTGLVLRAAVGGKEPIAGTLLGQCRKSGRHRQLHRIDHPQGTSRRRLLLRPVPRRRHSDPDAEVSGLPADPGAGGKAQRPALRPPWKRSGTPPTMRPLGYLVAKGWFLPEAICEGILYHHDPSVFDDKDSVNPQALTLIAINAMAEHFHDDYFPHARQQPLGNDRRTRTRSSGTAG